MTRSIVEAISGFEITTTYVQDACQSHKSRRREKRRTQAEKLLRCKIRLNYPPQGGIGLNQGRFEGRHWGRNQVQRFRSTKHTCREDPSQNNEREICQEDFLAWLAKDVGNQKLTIAAQWQMPYEHVHIRANILEIKVKYRKVTFTENCLANVVEKKHERQPDIVLGVN